MVWCAGLQADLPAAKAGQLGVGGVGALNGEGDSAVCVEQVGIVIDEAVKPQVVDGLVNVEEPQIGAPSSSEIVPTPRPTLMLSSR